MQNTRVADDVLTPLRGVVQDKAPLAGPQDRAPAVERREHDGRCFVPRRVGSRRPLRKRQRRHGRSSSAHRA